MRKGCSVSSDRSDPSGKKAGGSAMKLTEYGRYDGTGLAKLVRNGDVSPTELARTALDAVEHLNPALNAVVEIYRERGEGLDDATLPDGPFRGVPFLLKRIGIAEEGRPVSDLGTQLLREIDLPKSRRDSYVVGRFREAGLNIMGHTTMPELAYTISVESLHQGVTHNPWSRTAIAGGSSTGSAVAVASGMVPMAHASDAAGSTRFPASCNGVIGFKPSRGRISLGPDASDVAHLKLSHFAVTRTVRDTAAMMDALQGGMPGESVIYRPSDRPFAAEVGTPPGKLRIALSNMGWHTHTLDTDVKAQIDRLGTALEALGHHVTEDKPAIDFDAYRDHYRSVYYMDGAVNIFKLRLLTGGPVDTSKLQPLIQRIVARAGDFTIHDYAAAIEATNGLSRTLGGFFENYDVLLTPAMAETLPAIGEFSLQSEMSADAFCERLLGCNQYLPLSNLTGTPAITLPLCQTSDGLPLGAHFIGPIGEDARLIRLSAQLEEALPWIGRMPEVHVAKPAPRP
jgi:amidase